MQSACLRPPDLCETAALRPESARGVSGVVSVFVACALVVVPSSSRADEQQPATAPQRLVIAFASLRERPAFSNLFIYHHDGVGKGELVASVPALHERGDSHPTLTADGTVCVYASKQVGGFPPLINFWHVRDKHTLPGPPFNSLPGARSEPSVSGAGRLLAYAGRGTANSAGGWDVGLCDVVTGKPLEVPGLNSDSDEREVAISRNGRFLAFVTNRPDGAGLSDIAVYDRNLQELVPLPALNSKHRELNPALSEDGRWLAFVSDRPGAGGKDILLYDCTLKALVDLPGLNSVAHEQTPALSSDGRYLVFVSERTSALGERDIFLYDRQLSQLVPTPGLNSKQEDFDPCLAVRD